MPGIFKKPVSALATLALMAGVKNKADIDLERVWSIHPMCHFWKGKEIDIQALIDLSCEVNAMTLVYTVKLGLITCHINIRA